MTLSQASRFAHKGMHFATKERVFWEDIPKVHTYLHSYGFEEFQVYQSDLGLCGRGRVGGIDGYVVQQKLMYVCVCGGGEEWGVCSTSEWGWGCMCSKLPGTFHHKL